MRNLQRSFCLPALSPKLDVISHYTCVFALRRKAKIFAAFLCIHNSDWYKPPVQGKPTARMMYWITEVKKPYLSPKIF
jgi:hypothetical protein